MNIYTFCTWIGYSYSIETKYGLYTVNNPSYIDFGQCHRPQSDIYGPNLRKGSGLWTFIARI